MNSEKPLLIQVLPEFCEELRSLLREGENKSLVKKVGALRYFGICDCDDVGCASFYTAPTMVSDSKPSVEIVVLDPEEGMLILDIVDNEITFIEILDRPDIKEKIGLQSKLSK